MVRRRRAWQNTASEPCHIAQMGRQSAQVEVVGLQPLFIPEEAESPRGKRGPLV